MKLASLCVFFGGALGAAGCDTPGDRAGGTATATTATTSTSRPDASSGSDTTSGTSANDTSNPDDDPDPASVAAVCTRWNADRAQRAEGSWSGSAQACEAGDIGEPGRANTLRQVNLFRWLAHLPAVTDSAAKNEAAQACALLMHANDTIDHSVPASWRCYDALGAEAAGLSNLATTGGVEALDLYMTDEGVGNLGHRRWVLSNSLGPIGMGSTSRFSCLHVIGGSGRAGARWTAWPPEGIVPIDALEIDVGWGVLSTDSAGWSIQSDAIDLRRAEVTVTRDGQSLPIEVRVLDAGYGSSSAIAIVPDGWSTQAGATYHVSVTGLSEDIDYAVQVVDCAD